MDSITTIPVRMSTRKKLNILKAKKDLKNYDELVRLLIKKENGDIK